MTSLTQLFFPLILSTKELGQWRPSGRGLRAPHLTSSWKFGQLIKFLVSPVLFQMHSVLVGTLIVKTFIVHLSTYQSGRFPNTY